MKHITVQSFICASVDQTIPAMGANKHTPAMADRKLGNLV
jgi:hypothetical protein